MRPYRDSEDAAVVRGVHRNPAAFGTWVTNARKDDDWYAGRGLIQGPPKKVEHPDALEPEELVRMGYVGLYELPDWMPRNISISEALERSA